MAGSVSSGISTLLGSCSYRNLQEILGPTGQSQEASKNKLVWLFSKIRGPLARGVTLTWSYHRPPALFPSLVNKGK